MNPINSPAAAGCKNKVQFGSAFIFGRAHAIHFSKISDAIPPATPSTTYAPISSQRATRNGGTRNSESAPRNARIVTTDDTAESTIAPSTPALQVPITSSMTNSTAEIGALNAAANPAAAPTGAINRTFSVESL